MTCDIHLFVEKKFRKQEVKSIDGYYWFPCAFHGEFSDKLYGMFAALNNVRNYWNIEPLEDRGLPKDIGVVAFRNYYKLIGSKETEDEYSCSKEDADKWVKEGLSVILDYNGFKYCSDPDAHSPNWCTAKEMEECCNRVFKNNLGDGIEWIALSEYMKALEKTGEFETRAVFWFDN